MDNQPDNKQRDLTEFEKRVIDSLQPMQELAAMYARGKRKDNNWSMVRRTFLSALVLAVCGLYGLFYWRAWGGQTDPIADSAAIIPIQGPIAPGLSASADVIVPLIERACKSSRVKTVVLKINSPGGVPSESERVMSAIDHCRAGDPENDVKGKHFVALIDGVGASAAYMISMRADEIVAGRYSMVGSIGAIARFTDISDLAHRLGVWERTYRSAELKGGPSMLSGATPVEDELHQSMVEQLGRTFLAGVVASRGDRLKADESTLFTGRVWMADEALELGLIDQVAVFEDLRRTSLKDLRIHTYSTKPSIADQLGLTQALSTFMADVQAPRYY